MLKQVLFGSSSFWQAVCFTIMKNGTSSFMTSARDALVFVQLCVCVCSSGSSPSTRGGTVTAKWLER